MVHSSQDLHPSNTVTSGMVVDTLAQASICMHNTPQHIPVLETKISLFVHTIRRGARAMLTTTSTGAR